MSWAQYFGGLIVMFGILGIVATGVVIWFEFFVRNDK